MTPPLTTKPDAGGLTPEPALPRETYTLLAQANLLRMRARWDEAVEHCMAALRLSPENASAHSLLGDIYENQGRLDDAIQWYRMALDVNPDSPADRLKLDRLLEAKQRVLTTAHPHSDFTPLAPITLQPQAAPGLRSPERLLRWGAWLMALLTVLVVVLAGLAMAGGHRASETQVKAPAVTLPTSDIPALAAPTGAADPSEAALLQTLQQDPQLTAQNITPVSVQTDPRQSTVTLTLVCPSVPAGASARENLLRDSLLALRTADHAQASHVPAWTVRCYLPGATPEAGLSLAFVADTTPTALTAVGPDAPSLSAAQLLPAFQNPWWSSGIPP